MVRAFREPDPLRDPSDALEIWGSRQSTGASPVTAAT